MNGRIFAIDYRWDTPDIIAASNVVVIASLRSEASPIVLREAFASARPVVATKVGDVPEIITHRQNGLLVEPGDSRALADAILAFLTDRALAERCAANGLRYAREHFAFDQMMESKLRIDAEVVGTARNVSAKAESKTEAVVAAESVSRE